MKLLVVVLLGLVAGAEDREGHAGVPGLEDLIVGPPVGPEMPSVTVEPAGYRAHFRKQGGELKRAEI